MEVLELTSDEAVMGGVGIDDVDLNSFLTVFGNFVGSAETATGEIFTTVTTLTTTVTGQAFGVVKGVPGAVKGLTDGVGLTKAN